jgi:hypothetical protein
MGLPSMLRRAASTLVPVAALSLCVATVGAATIGCGRKARSRAASFTPPPLPAGFVEQSGSGWRIAVPSTWKDAAQKGASVFAVADPQAVDDFHAYANVVTEPYAGESEVYAKANEAGLRKEPRASVETIREDVIDGDPTLVLESRWAPASPSTVVYRTMQAALASRGTGYVVTCAVSSTAFERYRTTCESIVRSFAVER